MFVKDLMKTLTKMNLNGKSVKLVLPDGSVGNIDCLDCEDEFYVFYYKPEASGLDAKQLLSHMEAEASNECWGDSPNFKGYDADATSKFADCLIAIDTGDESDDGIMSRFCADSIVKKGSTLLIVSPTTDELRTIHESIFNDEENERKRFEDRCYELYQLEWMMSHGYGLDDLYKVMLKYEKDMFDPENFRDSDGNLSYENEFNAEDLERAAMQARDIFLFEQGFGHGQIFACKEEFLDAEYQDAAYMKWLFETQVDEEADKLKALYTKYTGKQFSCVADLKVHTDAGTLRAYRLTDPEHPGICVMLQPKGHDVEIDVTMAESDGKNINIVNWGDATTEDSTHRETLLGDDIEATLRPRVLSKEELKPIIFDEWKKFTFYDGENISADEIDNVPQELLDEIAFRCDSLETDDITQNIRACLKYAKDRGTRALIKEMDDCNIWNYIS